MNKVGQVWVETVLYTLIGLALIGLVLAFVSPRINEAKDKIVVDQTISSLSQLDEKINAAITGGSGNRRSFDITMKRGELLIDPKKDQITFYISNLNKPYSQSGIDTYVQRIKVHSETGQKTSSVNLTLDYSGNVNITYNGEDSEIPKKFNAAPTPYQLLIYNSGNTIDLSEVSNG